MSEFASQLRATQQNKQVSRQLVESRITSFASSNIGCSLRDKNEDVDAGTEPWSQLRLANRYLASPQVDVLLENKKVFGIANLLAEVYPPDFNPPEHPNYVLIAIVGRRGEFKQTQRGSKFVLLTLTDLQYELTLAIHGKSFEKYWKIRPGTIIGILNPAIYVAKTDTRSLGLSIRDDNCVIEIGRSRDCGQCEGITANSKRCRNWVDLRRTQVCDFHREIRMHKTASQRPEFNSTYSRFYDPQQGGKRLTVYKGGSVPWKEGLQADYQAPATKLYQSGAMANFMGGYEESVVSKDKQKRREKRKADDLKREMTLRKKLAQRPGGFLLREFDHRGNVLDEPVAKKTVSHRAFAPEQLRRIGFDPTQGQAASTFAREEDESDLEIIG